MMTKMLTTTRMLMITRKPVFLSSTLFFLVLLSPTLLFLVLLSLMSLFWSFCSWCCPFYSFYFLCNLPGPFIIGAAFFNLLNCGSSHSFFCFFPHFCFFPLFYLFFFSFPRFFESGNVSHQDLDAYSGYATPIFSSPM